MVLISRVSSGISFEKYIGIWALDGYDFSCEDEMSIDAFSHCAGVAKLVDATDLKSVSCIGVGVRVPLPAPFFNGFFIICQILHIKIHFLYNEILM